MGNNEQGIKIKHLMLSDTMVDMNTRINFKLTPLSNKNVHST